MELRSADGSKLDAAPINASRMSWAHARGPRWSLGVVFAALIFFGITVAFRAVEEMMLPPLPPPPAVPIREFIWDGTVVWFSITENWKRVPYVAPILAIRSDESLWRRMYLRNWDTVPSRIREEALGTMFGRYQRVIANPMLWDSMKPENWDQVPQPIRALAYGHMAAYWSGYYRVGAEQYIPRQLMADTLHAIVMSESWFEHRAVNVSIAGNRDLGVAQASDYTRERMRTLFRLGLVDIAFADEDYFDPWKGTRFLAIWMKLMLDEVGGNLDLAIQAYHAGSHGALSGDAVDYLRSIKRNRLFLRNPAETAPAWKYLWTRDREAMGKRASGARP